MTEVGLPNRSLTPGSVQGPARSERVAQGSAPTTGGSLEGPDGPLGETSIAPKVTQAEAQTAVAQVNIPSGDKWIAQKQALAQQIRAGVQPPELAEALVQGLEKTSQNVSAENFDELILKFQQNALSFIAKQSKADAPVRFNQMADLTTALLGSAENKEAVLENFLTATPSVTQDSSDVQQLETQLYFNQFLKSASSAGMSDAQIQNAMINGINQLGTQGKKEQAYQLYFFLNSNSPKSAERSVEMLIDSSYVSKIRGSLQGQVSIIGSEVFENSAFDIKDAQGRLAEAYGDFESDLASYDRCLTLIEENFGANPAVAWSIGEDRTQLPEARNLAYDSTALYFNKGTRNSGSGVTFADLGYTLPEHVPAETKSLSGERREVFHSNIDRRNQIDAELQKRGDATRKAVSVTLLSENFKAVNVQVGQVSYLSGSVSPLALQNQETAQARFTGFYSSTVAGSNHLKHSWDLQDQPPGAVDGNFEPVTPGAIDCISNTVRFLGALYGIESTQDGGTFWVGDERGTGGSMDHFYVDNGDGTLSPAHTNTFSTKDTNYTQTMSERFFRDGVAVFACQTFHTSGKPGHSYVIFNIGDGWYKAEANLGIGSAVRPIDPSILGAGGEKVEFYDMTPEANKKYIAFSQPRNAHVAASRVRDSGDVALASTN